MAFLLQRTPSPLTSTSTMAFLRHRTPNPLTSTVAFLLHFLVLHLLLPPHRAAYPYRHCEGGDYDAGSLFQSNLNLLLSSLSSPNSSFVTHDEGSPPNRVYGLFLCRGDITSLPLCRKCALNATRDIQHLCPSSKQATVWYDTCQLRYSDLSFYSSYYDIEPEIDSSEQKATDPDTFIKLRRELLEKLCERAAYNSASLFATGTASVGANHSPEIYGMVQCTRDLSKNKCSQCLQENFSDVLEHFDAVEGGRVLGKSCNFRYEVFKFFEGVPAVLLTLPPPSPPPSSTPTQQKDGKGNWDIVINSIVIAVVVAFILTFTVCIFMRRRSAKNSQGMANPEEIPGPESLYFELSILKVATDNFSDFNKLGQGGFGAVYKGMLPNGQNIAVKKLSADSRQGIEELKNELLLVAKLQHRNLVRLRGVCLEGGEKLLVYEYMPNGSLDKFLFDPIRRRELNWERRFKIIEGIARGLLYLHEESHLKVIHRDLKASNVLLDANMKPKISDFGLARLFGGDETHAITRRVVGTFGYMAPEYARRGRFSTKLDVYSYGILVLEIVTGRRNSNFKNNSDRGQDILSYTWKHWTNRTTLETVDPALGEDYSRDEVFRCIQIGLLCAQEFPADRPSMSLVFLMLNSPAMPLQDPLLPSYLAGLTTQESDVSSKVSSQQSYLGSTDRSSASSVGSSQQSGPRIISNTIDAKQKGKERVESKLIRTFDSRRTEALPSQLSMSADHPNSA